MTITRHILKAGSHSSSVNHQNADSIVSGIYSEQAHYRTKTAPTPSWRKPDPSQWRYRSQK